MLLTEEYKQYQISILWSLILASVVALFVLIYGKSDSFLIINKYNSPQFDYFFRYLTFLGDGLIWIPAFLYSLLFKRKFLLAIIAAIIISTILTHFLKRVVFPDELRPIGIFENTIRTIEGLKVHRQHSFPSGHTSTAFTLALLLAFILKKPIWTFFFPLIAFFVGYSRVYLAQHFLTDVLAGMLVGIVSSSLAIYFYYMYLKKKSLKENNKTQVTSE